MIWAFLFLLFILVLAFEMRRIFIKPILQIIKNSQEMTECLIGKKRKQKYIEYYLFSEECQSIIKASSEILRIEDKTISKILMTPKEKRKYNQFFNDLKSLKFEY